MNKLYLLTALSLVLFVSCKNEKPKTDLPLSLIIGDPVDYGFKNALLFPVGSNYHPEINNAKASGEEGKKISNNVYFKSNVSREGMYDVQADKEYSNPSEEDFDIRNILFYNKLNGESFPLLNDTLHILSFAIHNEFIKPLIFYRMVKSDFNEDGKYNSKDPVMFCISDNEGKNLVNVTPDNEQFINYFYYKETNTILVKTAIDANNDKKFNSIDETTFREVKLESPAIGREIFSKALIDQLKSQLK